MILRHPPFLAKLLALCTTEIFHALGTATNLNRPSTTMGSARIAKGVSESLRSPVGRGMLDFFCDSVWQVKCGVIKFKRPGLQLWVGPDGGRLYVVSTREADLCSALAIPTR